MEWGLIGGSSHEPQDSPNRQWTREHIASFSQPSQSEDEPKVCTCSRGDTLAVSINATVHIFDKTRNLASFQIDGNVKAMDLCKTDPYLAISDQRGILYLYQYKLSGRIELIHTQKCLTDVVMIEFESSNKMTLLSAKGSLLTVDNMGLHHGNIQEGQLKMSMVSVEHPAPVKGGYCYSNSVYVWCEGRLSQWLLGEEYSLLGSCNIAGIESVSYNIETDTLSVLKEGGEVVLYSSLQERPCTLVDYEAVRRVQKNSGVLRGLDVKQVIAISGNAMTFDQDGLVLVERTLDTLDLVKITDNFISLLSKLRGFVRAHDFEQIALFTQQYGFSEPDIENLKVLEVMKALRCEHVVQYKGVALTEGMLVGQLKRSLSRLEDCSLIELCACEAHITSVELVQSVLVLARDRVRERTGETKLLDEALYHLKTYMICYGTFTASHWQSYRYCDLMSLSLQMFTSGHIEQFKVLWTSYDLTLTMDVLHQLLNSVTVEMLNPRLLAWLELDVLPFCYKSNPGKPSPNQLAVDGVLSNQVAVNGSADISQPISSSLPRLAVVVEWCCKMVNLIESMSKVNELGSWPENALTLINVLAKPQAAKTLSNNLEGVINATIYRNATFEDLRSIRALETQLADLAFLKMNCSVEMSLAEHTDTTALQRLHSMIESAGDLIQLKQTVKNKVPLYTERHQLCVDNVLCSYLASLNDSSEDKLLFLITEIKCDDKMGSATVALLTQLPIPWSDQIKAHVEKVKAGSDKYALSMESAKNLVKTRLLLEKYDIKMRFMDTSRVLLWTNSILSRASGDVIDDAMKLVAIYPTSLTPYYVYKFRLNKLLSKPMDFRLVLRDLKPGNKHCIDGQRLVEEILSSIEFHLNEVPELAAIQQAGLGCEEEYTECAMLASLFLINNYPSSRKGEGYTMYKSLHKIRTMYSLTITPARYKRDKPALLHQFIVGLFSKGCELRQADQAFTSGVDEVLVFGRLLCLSDTLTHFVTLCLQHYHVNFTITVLQRVMHQSADNADTVLPLVSEVVRVLSTQYTVQCNIALLLKVIELVIAATSQIGEAMDVLTAVQILAKLHCIATNTEAECELYGSVYVETGIMIDEETVQKGALLCGTIVGDSGHNKLPLEQTSMSGCQYITTDSHAATDDGESTIKISLCSEVNDLFTTLTNRCVDVVRELRDCKYLVTALTIIEECQALMCAHYASNSTVRDARVSYQQCKETLDNTTQLCRQDLLPLLLTSDDEFFALALIQTMPEEQVFAVARDIRRASRNYNDVLKLSNILLKVAHSKGDIDQVKYLTHEKNVYRWAQYLTQHNIAFCFADVKRAVTTEEYQREVACIVPNLSLSSECTVEEVMQFVEELVTEEDRGDLAEEVVTMLLEQMPWQDYYKDKLEVLLPIILQRRPDEAQTLLLELLEKVNSYNYEGINFIVDYLEMCGYKQSRCDRYHQLISILYNYKRNVPPTNAEILYGIKPEMVKTYSQHELPPASKERLPFHLIRTKLKDGSVWHFIQPELQENVKDIIQMASVLRITEEQFIYAAVQNIIASKQCGLLKCKELIELIEEEEHAYTAARWLAAQLPMGQEKLDAWCYCLEKAHSCAAENESNKDIQQHVKNIVIEKKSLETYLLLEDNNLLKDVFVENIKKCSPMITAFYRELLHTSSQFVESLISQHAAIWQGNMRFDALRVDLAKQWLLSKRDTKEANWTNTFDVDNFSRAVMVLQKVEPDTICGVLLEMIYYDSNADLSIHCKERFLTALFTTVPVSIIEKHKPVSELRDMLCAFYFIARLPYSLKLSVRKFIKCNKDNLVRSVLRTTKSNPLSLILASELVQHYNITDPALLETILNNLATTYPSTLLTTMKSLSDVGDVSKHWESALNTAIEQKDESVTELFVKSPVLDSMSYKIMSKYFNDQEGLESYVRVCDLLSDDQISDGA